MDILENCEGLLVSPTWSKIFRAAPHMRTIEIFDPMKMKAWHQKCPTDTFDLTKLDVKSLLLDVSEDSIPEHVKQTLAYFVENQDTLAKLIKKLCGNLCYYKNSHPSLFQLTSAQLLEIFYGWNDGDGNHASSSGFKWRVVTTSRMLAYQMYFILKSND